MQRLHLCSAYYIVFLLLLCFTTLLKQMPTEWNEIARGIVSQYPIIFTVPLQDLGLIEIFKKKKADLRIMPKKKFRSVIKEYFIIKWQWEFVFEQHYIKTLFIAFQFCHCFQSRDIKTVINFWLKSKFATLSWGLNKVSVCFTKVKI